MERERSKKSKDGTLFDNAYRGSISSMEMGISPGVTFLEYGVSQSRKGEKADPKEPSIIRKGGEYVPDFDMSLLSNSTESMANSVRSGVPVKPKK